MVLGRLALGALVLVWLCADVSAQTQLVTFDNAHQRGALWDVPRPLAGCQVSPPREQAGLSARVDIDCRGFTPGSGSLVVRLFSRVVTPSVWAVSSANAVFAAATGTGATAKILRPLPAAIGTTRNLWTEIEVTPNGATAGSLRVALAVTVSRLPPPLPSCPREPPPPAPPVIFQCAASRDCADGYRCAAECGMTCIPN